jgi:hypothetical protein
VASWKSPCDQPFVTCCGLGIGTAEKPDRALTVIVCVNGSSKPDMAALTVPETTIGPVQVDPLVGPEIGAKPPPENDHCVTVALLTVQVIESPRVTVCGEHDNCGGGAGSSTTVQAPSPTTSETDVWLTIPELTCTDPWIKVSDITDKVLESTPLP